MPAAVGPAPFRRLRIRHLSSVAAHAGRRPRPRVATHPDRATILFHDQANSLADPTLRQLFLAYDHAYDHAYGLGAEDPRLDDLASRIAGANRERHGSGELPGLNADSEIPALIQGAVNARSMLHPRHGNDATRRSLTPSTTR
ncbi:hypothetical protein [Streptomyces sp. NPDC054854]